MIPSKLFDPTAAKILSTYIPLANEPSSIFQYNKKNPDNADEFLGKLDYAIRDGQQFTLSYFETSGNTITQTSGDLPWSTRVITYRQQEANLSHTWNVSPSVVNQAWLSYTRSFAARANTPDISLGDLGSSYMLQGPKSLPSIGVNGYLALGQSIGGPLAGTNYYSLRDTLSLNKGQHSWKFGGELSLDKDLQYTVLDNFGVFSFDGSKTSGDPNLYPGYANGNGFADFLLGRPVRFEQDTPVDAADDFWYAAGFAQDDWRVSHKLTLNLGVRYDLQTIPVDPLNRQIAFIPGGTSTVSPTLPPGILLPGDPGIPRGIVPTPKLHFSPRIGFAYDPVGDGKTVLRGGGGIFWGSASGNEFNALSNFNPFAVRQQFNDVQSLTNPYGNVPGGSPFPFVYVLNTRGSSTRQPFPR